MKLFIRTVLFLMMLCCMGAIFMFSSQSGEKSHNISIEITQKLAENKIVEVEGSDEAMDKFNKVLRKYAHFIMFFILGLISSVLAVLTFERLRARLAYPLILCLVWAVVDEVHQLYVPGRTGKPTDVLIDFAGSLLAAVLVVAVVALIKYVRKNTTMKR